MQTRVFEGYFENNKFYNSERQLVRIPEQYKVFITLFNEPIEKKPIEKRSFSELFGEWKGDIHMSEDFDAPLDEMKEYM
ncbi:MAG: DUF2281 domain-containing protein [Oscillospiraceae bacterium]|nr:DUF2281 domain-containing protein [Oscillospiraceae bacterium]